MKADLVKVCLVILYLTKRAGLKTGFFCVWIPVSYLFISLFYHQNITRIMR